MTAMIHVTYGDITRSPDRMLVNAANPSLIGGGGVDGAWLRALPEIREGSLKIPSDSLGVRVPAGDARALTLKDGRTFIQAVGPIFPKGRGVIYPGESRVSDNAEGARVLRSTLEAVYNIWWEGEGDLSLPAISCGVYGCPLPEFLRALCEVHASWTSHRYSTPRTATLWLYGRDIKPHHAVSAARWVANELGRLSPAGSEG